MDGTKHGDSLLEHLRSRPWAPFLPGAFQMAVTEVPPPLAPLPDSLCPDSHHGPRN